MADISDVCTALLGIAGAALYPVPPTMADGYMDSVAGIPARVYEGWPTPELLDRDLKGRGPANADGTPGPPYKVDGAGKPVPLMHVTVYPAAVIAASASVSQPMDSTFVITPAVHGVTATISDDGTTVTLAGTPTDGEYVALAVDGRKVYSRVGATVDLIAEALLADMAADYPAATRNGASITIPGAFSLEARIGAPGVIGRKLHSQRQRILISVWAPDHVSRNKAAIAIDLAMKQSLRIGLPDTSAAIITYESTFLTDHWEQVGVFRRDLTYAAEFTTIEQITAYEVVSVGLPAITPGTPAPLAIAGAPTADFGITF